METQSPRPILQYGSRKRRYGRYDFERFEESASSQASIGHRQFYKVTVDCRFLFKKSQWGVIGDNKNPAGIIYLDLTFHQPKDSQLHSADVIVTLDDEDEELKNIRRKAKDQCPIQMTNYFGPKEYTGPEKTVHTKKSLHLMPSAQYAGFGAGGMGVIKESTWIQSNRWKFSGHLLPGMNRQGSGKDWKYKTVKWSLSESELEEQANHSNEVHTAFAFEHGGQPFFIKVEIKGKLKNFRGRVKDKMMKFPSKKNDGLAVTLIDFGERISFKTPLDQRAHQLQFEMEMANLHSIPMEISDPKPAIFSNVTAPSGLVSDSPPSQQLPTSAQPPLLQGTGGSATTIENSDNFMLANLAQTFEELRGVDHHDSPQKPKSLTPAKDVGDIGGIGVDHRLLGGKEELEGQNELSEEQMMLQLLKTPIFLTLLRMIAGLLGLFGQKPSSSTNAKEVNKKPAR